MDLSESASMTPSHALRSLSSFEADLQLSEPSGLLQQLENQILAEEPGSHVDLQQTPDTQTQAEKPASKKKKMEKVWVGYQQNQITGSRSIDDCHNHDLLFRHPN